jgi:hypothetical protein
MFQLASSVALLAIRADVKYLMGSVTAAEADWDALDRLARELDHPPSLAAGLAFLVHGGALRHSTNGSVGHLAPLIAELIDVTEGEGSLLWNAVGRCFEAAIETTNPESDRMEAAWESFAGTGSGLTEVLTRIAFAESRCRLGDTEGALRELNLAETAARSRGEWLSASEIWRIRGRIAAGDGRVHDAEVAFSESLAIADAQGASMLSLRTLLDRCAAEPAAARFATTMAMARLLENIDGGTEPEVLRARQMIKQHTEHNER